MVAGTYRLRTPSLASVVQHRNETEGAFSALSKIPLGGVSIQLFRIWIGQVRQSAFRLDAS